MLVRGPAARRSTLLRARDTAVAAADIPLIRVPAAARHPAACGEAAAELAPDVTLEPVGDYLMVSCSVAPGTVIPPAGEWTGETPAMLRDSMLGAIDGWHPALRGIVERTELDSIFVIPFGYLDPAPAWTPSRVTLIGDAAHAMLPTLGMGANLALRDVSRCSAATRPPRRDRAGGRDRRLRAGHARLRLPVHADAMDHDRKFGGGALERMG